MKLKYLLLSVVLIFTACQSGTSPKDGELKLGIVTGKFQTVSVGAEALPEPIVGRLVRTPSGQVAWHQVPSKVGGAFLDFLVPKAFASDTFVVQGAPIAGAAVCLNEDSPLVPFSRCVTTGSDGYATMFAKPGTTMGEQRGEIRGVIDGQALVFDTILVNVVPGPAVEFITVASKVIPNSEWALVSDLILLARDSYRNDIPSMSIEITSESPYMDVKGDTLRFSVFAGTIPVVMTLDGLVDTTFVTVAPDLLTSKLEIYDVCEDIVTRDWVSLYDSVSIFLQSDSIKLGHLGATTPRDDTRQYLVYLSGYEIRYTTQKDSVPVSFQPLEARFGRDSVYLIGYSIRVPDQPTALRYLFGSAGEGTAEYNTSGGVCWFHPQYVPRDILARSMMRISSK